MFLNSFKGGQTGGQIESFNSQLSESQIETLKLLVITLASLVIASSSYAQKTPQGVLYDAKIIRVTDGDTVVIAAPYLPPPLKPEIAVRVFGVDTPENRCSSSP